MEGGWSGGQGDWWSVRGEGEMECEGEGDMGSNGGGEAWGVMKGGVVESKGGGSGGEKGGREWRRVRREGLVVRDGGRRSSPGLIITHVCSHSCVVVFIIVHACSVHFHLPAVAFICEWSCLFMGGCVHSWAVAFMFIRGRSCHWPNVVCRHVSSASSLCGGRLLFGWLWGMGGVVDGGGGKEEATWQCLSHACHIWDDRCRGWDVYSCFMFSKAFMAQVA